MSCCEKYLRECLCCYAGTDVRETSSFMTTSSIFLSSALGYASSAVSDTHHTRRGAESRTAGTRLEQHEEHRAGWGDTRKVNRGDAWGERLARRQCVAPAAISGQGPWKSSGQPAEGPRRGPPGALQPLVVPRRYPGSAPGDSHPGRSPRIRGEAGGTADPVKRLGHPDSAV